MAESGADFTMTINKPSGNIKARISRIKRLSYYSVVKDKKLDDSDSVEGYFP